mmetsp:Transcript_28934/g.55331  ORF Transcript_28934/g.55331 Transcript_28934/m.55331 type:complete len:350 (-) Transcript_28934:968-2017(-)
MVSQLAVVHHLQQDVVDIWVRLFHFVQQEDTMRVLVHAVCQHATLVKAHIAGRGPDQAADRVLFHVFRHIKAQHFDTQRIGQLLGHFGLAHAGWTGKEVVADGFFRLAQACPRQFDGRGQRIDGVVLAKDHPFERCLKILERGRIVLGHVFGRNAGDFRHDILNLFGADGLAPFCSGDQMLCGARFVNHIDRAIGQLAVVDISAGQFNGGLDRVGGVFDAVMILEIRLEAPQDFRRILDRGLVHIDFLEPTGQRAIFLEMLAEFLVGSGTHGAQLAPLQGRFQQVGGIHRAARSSASTDNGVDFIDEQHRVWVLFQLGHDSFQAFLKITAIPGACQQSAHVEGVDGRFA